MTSQLIGREVRVYDSLAADTLTSSMDEQLARIYKPFVANGGLLVSRMPVQQQKDGFDCGLFSIVFAYHAAAGDNVKRLNFDQDKMRRHLVSCLSDQKLTPFPQHETAKKIVKCSLKHIFHCILGLSDRGGSLDGGVTETYDTGTKTTPGSWTRRSVFMKYLNALIGASLSEPTLA